MIVYPAIDLINGECTRLYKGDFNQKTVYEKTPVETAQNYKKEGAKWLHLVDLDGARDPAQRQTALIGSIIEQSGLKVQTGGGVRSADDVNGLINAGASRVVIGSMAVKEVEATKEIIKRFGTDKICLATDVIEQGEQYMIAVSGWQEGSNVTLNDLITDYLDVGLKHILCTDIARDGTMTGCNVKLYNEVKNNFPDIHLQASGGVSSLEDLKALNTDGVIIGKALYEGNFTVSEALSAVGEAVSC